MFDHDIWVYGGWVSFHCFGWDIFHCNVSNNEISNSGSGATTGSGSIDVEADDHYQDDEGMPIGENMEHDGLFELDAKESEESNDEMIWKF